MNVLLLFVWNCIVTQSQVCFIDIDFLKKTTSLFSKIFHIFEWLVLHTITKLAFYLKLLFYNQNSPYLDIPCRTWNEISNYSRFLIFFTIITFFIWINTTITSWNLVWVVLCCYFIAISNGWPSQTLHENKLRKTLCNVSILCTLWSKKRGTTHMNFLKWPNRTRKEVKSCTFERNNKFYGFHLRRHSIYIEN